MVRDKLYISFSVRGLVEFLLRRGDIDNRKSGPSVEEAMQEGSRIHRMLQRKAGGDYRSEVSLRYTYVAEHYELVLDGRADGIIGEMNLDDSLQEMTEVSDAQLSPLPVADPHLMDTAIALPENDAYTGVTIDEIKGTYKDLDKMKEPDLLHLAQAKCYAFMYAMENGNEVMRVRMTYCHMDTEEVRYFFYEYTRGELCAYFAGLMAEYAKWAEYAWQWRLLRLDSIAGLQFPFPFREGQKELVAGVYHTIVQKKKLFIEAPTGVGKTMSTVYPAIRAVGEGMAEKIFYLTAKTITASVAQEAFRILEEKGLKFKTVTITAKEKVCACEEVSCNPKDCPRAKGHFDRINNAVYDILTNEVSVTREAILEYAQKHMVCPFEMCLDLSLFADGIICDYNYAFDPHVYLRRFFSEGIPSSYLFLVDEAHNLLERGREMYSASLCKEDFLSLKNQVMLYDKKMSSALERCNRQLLILKKQCDEYRIIAECDDFYMQLSRLASVMERFLEEHEESPLKEAVLEFYFQVSHFMLIYEKVDANYVMYTKQEADNTFVLRLFCVDPSGNLKECMARARSTILFSATLLPIQYYKSLLGGEESDYELYARSVFDPKRRLLVIGNDITSKYTRRGYAEYLRAACYIKEITGLRKGNYMVFFPSYAFMRQVYDLYMEQFFVEEAECCIIQGEYMKEQEREEFLQRFKTADDKILVGFCVMGGIFSEGIDLKGESLIGAIIVGTGLPLVCPEREIMKDYFDERERGESGFSYAYMYPGMNKVLQAAGRVIRTTSDKGIVALLDERFLQRSYRSLFPREWENYQVVNCASVTEPLQEFWEAQDDIDTIMLSEGRQSLPDKEEASSQDS